MEEINTPSVENISEVGIRPHIRWWGWLLAVLLVAGVVGMFLGPTRASSFSFSFMEPLKRAPDLPKPWGSEVQEEAVDAIVNAHHNSVPKAQTMFDGKTYAVLGTFLKAEKQGSLFSVDLAPLIDKGNGWFIRFYFSDEVTFAASSQLTVGDMVYIVSDLAVSDEGITGQNSTTIYKME